MINVKFNQIMKESLGIHELHRQVPTKETLNGIGKNKKVSGPLAEVANQFEAIFLERLLSASRESKLSDGLFETSSDDNFEQLFDQEIAKSSSKTVDLGIADAIIRQMSKSEL